MAQPLRSASTAGTTGQQGSQLRIRAAQRAEPRRAEEAAMRPAITRCAFTLGCAGMNGLPLLSARPDFSSAALSSSSLLHSQRQLCR